MGWFGATAGSVTLTFRRWTRPQVKVHGRYVTPAGVLDALRFKCNVLWAQLDALHYAYVEPGLVPPGAFVPDKA